MRLIKRMALAILALTLISDSTFARRSVPSHAPIYYRVQKGDHLADILRKFKITYLWGPVGAIEYTISLNPALQKNGADSLPIGEFIQIPIHPPTNNLYRPKNYTIVNKDKKNKRNISAIPPDRPFTPKKISFPSSNDRQYEILLVENDGRKRHVKLEFPIETLSASTNGEIIHSFVTPNDQELALAAAKEISHSKNDFFAIPKKKTSKTADGKTITQIYYEPWRLTEKLYTEFDGGGYISSVSDQSPTGVQQNFSSNPSLFARADLGFEFTDQMALYVLAKGDYLWLRSDDVKFSVTNILIPQVGIGFRWSPLVKTDIHFEGHYRRDYLFSSKEDFINVTRTWRPTSSFFVDQQILKNGPHTWKAKLGAEYLFDKSANTVKLNNSLGFFAQASYYLKLQEDLETGLLLKWEQKTQSSNLGESKENKINIGVRLDWN